MSETFRVGALLACAGGFMDAYTYICRGGIFANAQTGNIVFLGIEIAKGNLTQTGKYLVPILAFAFGIIVTEFIRGKFSTKTKIHWRQAVILLEIIVLAIVSFIPQGKGLNVLVNIIVSFACAMQVQSFRKVDGSIFVTTMCTGNLRSATEHLYKAAVKKDNDELMCSLKYIGIILFFVLGAVIGAAATSFFSIHAMLFACLGLAVVFGMMFVKHI